MRPPAPVGELAGCEYKENARAAVLVFDAVKLYLRRESTSEKSERVRLGVQRYLLDNHIASYHSMIYLNAGQPGEKQPE